jgi:hypothetical protein
MIVLGFMLVLAYANNLIVPAWAWVLFWVQLNIKIAYAISKVFND